MPGGSRALPARPNLRYLRLEAKRRLAAGEFATLHAAQTAIAREHGQVSWAALKQLVQAGPDGQQQDNPQQDAQPEDGQALAQIRWVISRFSGLRDSSFPARRTDIGPGAVTSYHLTLEGTFEPTAAMIPTIPAAGGLWSTGADLVRLGLGWSSHSAAGHPHPRQPDPPSTDQPPDPGRLHRRRPAGRLDQP